MRWCLRSAIWGSPVAKAWAGLGAKYQEALQAYLEHQDEEDLQRAYELGRAAIRRGLGVLDMARLHQEALVRMIASAGTPVLATKKQAKTVETFLLEGLSPFEAAHRGFRDACGKLRQLNETLEQRNGDLASLNIKLQEEILEREKAREQLDRRERQLARAQRQASLGSYEWDLRTGRMNWSDELYRIHGLSPRKFEPTFEAYLARVHPEDRNLSRRSIKEAIRQRGAFAFDERIIRADQKIRILHSQGEVMVDENGKPARLVGSCQDITARRLAEDALRESREHYFALFQQAHVMGKNLRMLSLKVLSAQEEERKRISRELHDEVGQALTAVNVTVALLRKHAGPDKAFRRKVDAAQKLLLQTMGTVHRFARELRPDMLDHLGPYEAIRSYARAFARRTGIKAAIQPRVDMDGLDSRQGMVLYRVAQESLTNVFKHAKASRVKVGFRRLPRGICMEICDNGRSFEAGIKGPMAGGKHLGLLGMQERVRLVNGEFAVEAQPGRGTIVRVRIPFGSSRRPAEKGLFPPSEKHLTLERAITHRRNS
jgi:PAS domain S-box-containing protein